MPKTDIKMDTTEVTIKYTADVEEFRKQVNEIIVIIESLQNKLKELNISITINNQPFGNVITV